MVIKRHEKSEQMTGIGGRLRHFRIYKGLTQSEFAEILGTNQNNLSGIENGYRGITDLMLVRLYRKYPDFDAKEILVGE